MGQQVQQWLPNVENAAGNGNGNDDCGMNGLVEQFTKLRPLKFSRTKDPKQVESWIDELQKIFELLRCSEEEKVNLEVFQLGSISATS